jgi:Ca2+-transporting ATPase
MTVTRMRWNGQEAGLAEEEYRDRDGGVIASSRAPDLARLIEVCVLCNDAELPGSASDAAPGSSTETALLEAANRLGGEVEAVRASHPRISTVERAAGRRYMATLHTAPQGETLIAVKGDPMAVLALCGYRSEGGKQHQLDAAAREAIEMDNLAMAQAGLRVLGIAFRLVPGGEDLESALTDLVWLGLVGMADPIRRGAAELVHVLQRAGIATVMLTGDQRATAVAIATELGLSPNSDAEVVEGDQLSSSAIPGNSRRIFARLTPTQKLQVIADLQRSGQRVAMVGDGVNDTPALKVADVGITLAASATDIARDVADIVLLGEDLAPLAFAFEAGRSVHGNIRRAIRFLIATNLSEIFMMLFAVASGLTRPLSPGQLLWINLLSDVLPAMGLALEPSDPELMAGPLPAPAPILSGADLPLLARDAGLIAGSSVAAEVSAAMLRGPAAADAVGFTSLVTGQLLYALACAPKGRPISGNLIGALAASFGAQAAALSLPSLRRLVGHRLGATGLALSAAAGLLPLLLVSAFDGSRPAGDRAPRQASEPSASNA